MVRFYFFYYYISALKRNYCTWLSRDRMEITMSATWKIEAECVKFFPRETGNGVKTAVLYSPFNNLFYIFSVLMLKKNFVLISKCTYW